MNKGKNVLNSLKIASLWLFKNSDIMIETTSNLLALKSGDKLNQLEAIVVDLDKNIRNEIISIHKQLHIIKIILLFIVIILFIITVIGINIIHMIK